MRDLQETKKIFVQSVKPAYGRSHYQNITKALSSKLENFMQDIEPAITSKFAQSVKPAYGRGFTLAEVLITLGIIGVVAALTLPVITSKIDEIVMVNKLKKSYSLIANALELRKQELGADDYSGVFDRTTMTEKEIRDGIMKHLNVVEACDTRSSTGCGGNYSVKYPKPRNDGYGKNSSFIMLPPRYVLNDGTIFKIDVKNSEGGCKQIYIDYEKDSDGNYILVNGERQPYSYTYSTCASIFFDVNGLQGRNQFGYDAYAITVVPNKLNAINNSYGNFFEIMRTGKLDYVNYETGGDFQK